MDRADNSQCFFDAAFTAAASAHPDAPAVLCEHGSRVRAMTYRQLDEYSDRAAGLLARLGIACGSRVPLLLDRTFDAVAMPLAVAKAGAAFAFIAPDAPPERLRHMLRDLGAKVLLRHSRFRADIPRDIATVDVDKVDWLKESARKPSGRTGPDDHLAIFYTSGTTGVPKGAILTHRNVLAFSRMDTKLNNIAYGTRLLAQAEMTFDAFLWNIFPALLAGARIYLIDAESRMSLVATHEFMVRHRLENAFLTTRLAEEYIHNFTNPYLKLLGMGGEKMRPVPRRTYGIRNFYGPTETTVYVTSHLVAGDEDDVPVGVPVGENHILVMGADGKACPDGHEGEICIAGPQTSPGYLNMPELTAEKFVPNPHWTPERAPCYTQNRLVFGHKQDVTSESVLGNQLQTNLGWAYRKMYRTGDLGARLPGGAISYRGRIDRMVKIRGHRIEPGEVETALRRHPALADAVVVPRRDSEGNDFLVAYYVSAGGDSPPDHLLRSHLEGAVPAYMVPAYFMPLQEIPLAANGKVNVGRLPPPA